MRALPPELRELLSTIESFEKLDLVRLLWEGRERWWSVEEIAGQCSVTAERVPQVLADLVGHGLVTVSSVPGMYRAACEGPTGEAVERVLALYRTDPDVIAQVLTDLAMARIRASFARAFPGVLVPRPRRGRPRKS